MNQFGAKWTRGFSDEQLNSIFNSYTGLANIYDIISKNNSIREPGIAYLCLNDIAEANLENRTGITLRELLINSYKRYFWGLVADENGFSYDKYCPNDAMNFIEKEYERLEDGTLREKDIEEYGCEDGNMEIVKMHPLVKNITDEKMKEIAQELCKSYGNLPIVARKTGTPYTELEEIVKNDEILSKIMEDLEREKEDIVENALFSLVMEKNLKAIELWIKNRQDDGKTGKQANSTSFKDLL